MDASAPVSVHDFKIAYQDELGTYVWHSHDSSVDPFGFAGVGTFTYDGKFMGIVDQATSDVLDGSGQVIRKQALPPELLAVLDARPRPDGNRLVVKGYPSPGPPTPVFGTLDPDGSYHQLADSVMDSPVYAPDGKTLLFVDLVPNGDYAIQTIQDDGSGRKTLIASLVPMHSPAFSYDQAHVVYLQPQGSMASIAMLDVASSVSTTLLTSATSTFGAPSFTPDGAAVVFVERHSPNDSSVVRLDLASKTATTLFAVASSEISVAAD